MFATKTAWPSPSSASLTPLKLQSLSAEPWNAWTRTKGWRAAFGEVGAVKIGCAASAASAPASSASSDSKPELQAATTAARRKGRKARMTRLLRRMYADVVELPDLGFESRNCASAARSVDRRAP